MKNYTIFIENKTLGQTRKISKVGDEPRNIHKKCMMSDLDWNHEEIVKILDNDNNITVYDVYRGFV